MKTPPPLPEDQPPGRPSTAPASAPFTMPPPLPAATMPSIYQRNASAALFLVIAGVILHVGIKIGNPSREALILLWSINSLLYLLAFIAGSIALLGMGREGHRGLLVHGILGVVIPILAFLSALPTFLSMRDSGSARQPGLPSSSVPPAAAEDRLRDGMVRLLSQSLNENSPIAFSETLRLDGAELQPDQSTVFLRITHLSASQTRMDHHARTELRPMLRDLYRTSEVPEITFFRESGVPVTFLIRDREGKAIEEITLSPDDRNP